jgi:TRAP-type transport system periplasmic protein
MLKFPAALVTLSLICFSPMTSAKTFKIATVAPDGTSWMSSMRAAGKTITKRTEGRVKFTFYPGGVMGNDKTVLRKIKIRQLHGGMISSGSLAEIFPDTLIYNLPFSFKSFSDVDYVRARMDGHIIAGLKRKGFISFGLTEIGFAYLMSNRPLRSVENLREQKVWVPEGDIISRTAFEAVGVSPVPLSLIDVLTGLQTGLVDTVGASPVGAIALQWHTRVKHLTETPLLYLFGSLVIQRKAFESLSPSDRKIMREVIRGTVRKLGHQARQDNASALIALRKQGIGFVTPPTGMLVEWKGKVAKAMDSLGERGYFSLDTLRVFRGYLRENGDADSGAR